MADLFDRFRVIDMDTHVERTLGDVPEATLQKVLHDTAAGLYGIE